MLRAALRHQSSLPGEPARTRPAKPALPELPWERNQTGSHFTVRRVAYLIVDIVARCWIGYVLSVEQTTTQVHLLFADALSDQACSPPTPSRPQRTTI